MLDLNSQIFLETEKLVSFAHEIKKGTIGTYRDVALSLKKIHILNALKVSGSTQNLSYSDLGIIGNILKKQYYQGKDESTNKPYGLKFLFKESSDLSEKMIAHRLRMFAQIGNITANILEQKKSILNGKTKMRRILGQTDFSCPECLSYAGQGWKDIGNLPLPHQKCTCRANCKCKVEYK